MQLLNGDCLELMKTLPDKSVDLFICDLPYGCLTGGAGKEKEARRKRFVDGKDTGTEIRQNQGVIAGCDWDIKIDLEAFWIQVERLMKNDHTPIIQFCNTKFGYDLIKSKEKWFRYDLVWDKMRGVSFLLANKMPMKSHEMIYVFSKKGANYNRIDIDAVGKGGRTDGDRKTPRSANMFSSGLISSNGAEKDKACIKSVIQISKAGTKNDLHPTEKPIELYKFLIERYSNEGDTVLDPTFGSGNSGLASTELKRKYIGIEKDEGFFKKFFSVQDTNATHESPPCREG